MSVLLSVISKSQELDVGEFLVKELGSTIIK